jgi:glycosyltransferase involved in cell wall biosynthesis
MRKSPLPYSWLKDENVKVLDGKMPNKLFDLLARFSWVNIEAKILPDVIFSPHFQILPQTSAPRVITFHDLSFLHHPDFFLLKQHLWHWLQNYAKQARSAERVIAVSEFTKNDLMAFLRVPEEKIRVVYSGISNIFYPQKQELVSEFRKARGLNSPFMLYLGTIEPRKNLRGIIRAFSLLKCDKNFSDLELVLAGPKGWLFEEVFKEARKSEARDSIRFLGQVEGLERPLLYSAAEIFVYPSFFEGFGFPPLEAQACGTPVVVSNRTSLPEIFGSSALMVDPWRVEEIADAVRSLLSHTSLREEMAKKGIENAKRFSWSRAAWEMRKIFEEIVR